MSAIPTDPIDATPVTLQANQLQALINQALSDALLKQDEQHKQALIQQERHHKTTLQQMSKKIESLAVRDPFPQNVTKSLQADRTRRVQAVVQQKAKVTVQSASSSIMKKTKQTLVLSGTPKKRAQIIKKSKKKNYPAASEPPPSSSSLNGLQRSTSKKKLNQMVTDDFPPDFLASKACFFSSSFHLIFALRLIWGF